MKILTEVMRQIHKQTFFLFPFFTSVTRKNEKNLKSKAFQVKIC